MSGPQQQSESEDELDALLQHYERQAAADVAAVQQQQGGGVRKKQKLSAAEQREEALSQPIAADNKCARKLHHGSVSGLCTSEM